MREASVVGFIPSNSAAPPEPDTLPLDSFRAARMLSASNCLNSESVNIRFVAVTGIGVTRMGEGDAFGNSIAKRPPTAVMIALSITCWSSRTFPGQEYF